MKMPDKNRLDAGWSLPMTQFACDAESWMERGGVWSPSRRLSATPLPIPLFTIRYRPRYFTHFLYQ